MVAKELVDKGARILVGFVLVWGLCFGYKRVGCCKFDGSEMTPAIEAGQFKFTRPVRSVDDLATDDIVGYELYGMAEAQTSFGGRVKARPGEIVSLETSASTFLGHEADKVDLICPRDYVLLQADNEQTGKQYDSRHNGPVGFYTIKGKKW